jgi:hypothetical protein
MLYPIELRAHNETYLVSELALGNHFLPSDKLAPYLATWSPPTARSQLSYGRTFPGDKKTPAQCDSRGSSLKREYTKLGQKTEPFREGPVGQVIGFFGR